MLSNGPFPYLPPAPMALKQQVTLSGFGVAVLIRNYLRHYSVLSCSALSPCRDLKKLAACYLISSILSVLVLYAITVLRHCPPALPGIHCSPLLPLHMAAGGASLALRSILHALGGLRVHFCFLAIPQLHLLIVPASSWSHGSFVQF